MSTETLTPDELNMLIAMPEADFERLQELACKTVGTRSLVVLDRKILEYWYAEQENEHGR